MLIRTFHFERFAYDFGLDRTLFMDLNNSNVPVEVFFGRIHKSLNLKMNENHMQNIQKFTTSCLPKTFVELMLYDTSGL